MPSNSSRLLLAAALLLPLLLLVASVEAQAPCLEEAYGDAAQSICMSCVAMYNTKLRTNKCNPLKNPADCSGRSDCNTTVGASGISKTGQCCSTKDTSKGENHDQCCWKNDLIVTTIDGDDFAAVWIGVFVLIVCGCGIGLICCAKKLVIPAPQTPPRATLAGAASRTAPAQPRLAMH